MSRLIIQSRKAVNCLKAPRLNGVSRPFTPFRTSAVSGIHSASSGSLSSSIPLSSRSRFSSSSSSSADSHSASEQKSSSSAFGLITGLTAGATLVLLGLHADDVMSTKTAHASPALGSIQLEDLSEEHDFQQHASHASEDETGVSGEEKQKRSLNPGKWDDLSRGSKEVMYQETFDGFRIDVAQGLVASPKKQFNVSHHLWLGSQQAPEGSYEFGTQLLLNQGTMLHGRVEPASGRMQGQLRLPLAGESAVSRSVFAFGPDGFTTTNLELDLKGSDWTASGKVNDFNVISMAYLQTVAPNWAVGLEGIHFIEQLGTIVSGGARWKSEDDTQEATATVSSMRTLSATYSKKAHPSVALATEFMYNYDNNASALQFGAHYTFRQSQVKSGFDTNGRVSSTVDFVLAPVLRMSFSGEVNAFKEEYKFGFGFTVEGSASPQQ